MFICTELIEETGRPPGLIFGMWGYFWTGSDKFEFWNFFHTFDGVNTHCHILSQNLKKNLNSKISKKKSHFEASNANLKQTTTAKWLLFAQDTS